MLTLSFKEKNQQFESKDMPRSTKQIRDSSAQSE